MTGEWMEQIRAGNCYLADSCMMDPICPFLGMCQRVEDGPTVVLLDRKRELTDPEPTEILDQDTIDKICQARKESAVIMVSQELLDDTQKFDWADMVAHPERYKPTVRIAAKPHRCLACWLVSLLPGHHRCHHGHLACEECELESAGW